MFTAIAIRFPSLDLPAFARLLCLCLLVVAAIPLTVALVHLAWPLLVAVAGKAALAAAGLGGYAAAFRP